MLRRCKYNVWQNNQFHDSIIKLWLKETHSNYLCSFLAIIHLAIDIFCYFKLDQEFLFCGFSMETEPFCNMMLPFFLIKFDIWSVPVLKHAVSQRSEIFVLYLEVHKLSIQLPGQAYTASPLGNLCRI
jgi:hypothetical protein